ncbi:MAG: mechanosensitive ion channel family protein [Balneolaceae bacterium]
MIDRITSVLLEAYETFFNSLADFLPSLIGALLILIVGWIIAKLVKTAAIKLLKLIKLDVVTEKAKIDQFLRDGGSKKTAIDILGAMIYWLIMLIVILAGLDALGLGVASELFNQIILYIPNVIVAVLALIFGVFLAGFIAQVVSTYLANVGVSNANVIGAIARYAIILFVISLSLTQLNIGEELVSNAFLLLFGAVCLALGLSFGLGGKEWAAGVIKKLTEEQ